MSKKSIVIFFIVNFWQNSSSEALKRINVLWFVVTEMLFLSFCLLLLFEKRHNLSKLHDVVYDVDLFVILGPA